MKTVTSSTTVTVRRVKKHSPFSTQKCKPTVCFMVEVALLLVVLVIPVLHIIRAGIDQDIAFLLLGFDIVLSEDKMEVVQVVTYYTWLLEGGYSCSDRPSST